MSERANGERIRVNDDFSTSYTHERPAPTTSPPTTRATSDKQAGTKPSSTDSNKSSTSC